MYQKQCCEQFTEITKNDNPTQTQGYVGVFDITPGVGLSYENCNNDKKIYNNRVKNNKNRRVN